MAVNAFLTFFDKANGESIQVGKERWVEIQGWDWEIEAATSWTKGGGASVGKPTPGSMRWQHNFDVSSATIMGYICTGKAFPKVEIQVVRPAGGPGATYLTMLMDGVYITKVSTSGTEEGNVVQMVEMVFKAIKIDYAAQDQKTGKARPVATFSWDVTTGMVAPSA